MLVMNSSNQMFLHNNVPQEPYLLTVYHWKERLDIPVSDGRLFLSDVWLTVHRNSVWIRKTN